MKMSISLPAADVEFIDSYASRTGMASRSAVVQRALDLLRSAQLGPSYAQAWAEWETGDGADWESTVGDAIAG